MENLLKERGHKVTRARLAILDIFKRSKEPLDAKTVHRKLKPARLNSRSGGNKKINGVTVYRALTSFAEAGILKKVDLRKDSAYFELAGENLEHHHHIVCTNCDNVEDFKNSKIEKLLRRIVEKSSKFINIKEHSLELFGICKTCA